MDLHDDKFDKTNNINYYISQIVERLKQLRVYKIILFGSYAWGVPAKESDIDIMVVLDKDEWPKNYEEKMENKLTVRKIILDLSAQIPIDLVVYTKPMYRKFNELDSMFSREIAEKGKVLYEADYSGVSSK